MVEKLLHIDNLAIGYADKILINAISTSVKEGEFISLLGMNGVGKSTLLKVLSGIITPLSGAISLGGTLLSELSALEIAKQIAFVSTTDEAPENMTVYDYVALGRYPYTGWSGRLSEEDKSIVSEMLKKVAINQFTEKSLYQLSDGERQRTRIARALAQDTPIILLDEPTAFLDFVRKKELFELLLKLVQETNKSLILTTHDIHDVLNYCTSSWVLKEGELVVCGEKTKVKEVLGM